MHATTILTAILGAATLTQGAPTALATPDASENSLNEAAAENIGLVKRTDQCGHSTFTNIGNSNSPLVSDCERMANNLSGNGKWTITSFDVQKKLASYGTCAFRVTPAQIWIGTTFVGDRDVKDLVRDSIQMFRRSDGRVGAEGKMECGDKFATPEDYKMWWWIDRN
ncbi:putative necrosis-inducing factor-domain-containing protein [Triangularia setosa]|uniref:Necrosis-inducing factor-domain-containing protein n=1 Tax=Triangularia setosa TaxID=2587417 RepID=A0AAN7A2C7_9PEZI|nr:putative necrosis-inducing factor-domain-containing protein [Podospora setosa]